MREALYYKKIGDNVQCVLCPHKCIIVNGKTGLCRVRRNIDGTLIAEGYGKVISAHVDPIEKKPLYHFYPKAEILSVGFSSCNMRCPFCQNYELSQEIHEANEISVERLIDNVKFGIAFTYNEPLINYEYILDFAMKLKKVDISKKVVLVTNGMINTEPLKKLIPYVDAFNLDIKGNEAFYEFCKGSFDQVMENLKLMSKKHVEVTTLMVTDHVSLEDVEMIAKRISEVDSKIPYHISRYYPNYHMANDPTDVSEMLKAKAIADKYLEHVYLGNVLLNQNTYCSSCKNLLISRSGYQTDVKSLKCSCGYDNNIKGE